ncbi:MAG: DUF2807 domain-containing protein [Bacteroidales bacterium]|jgi:hypothetical protein|nr:DUF2807 domain-containing protein [Bacteroidales bacterium]
MKRLFAIIATCMLSVGFLTAQNSMATADFQNISVRHAIEVKLVPSDHYEIVFPSDLSWLEGLKTTDMYTVKAGTLKLAFPESFIKRTNRNLNNQNKRQKEPIVIYFKDLKSLSLSGASEAKSEKEITASQFNVKLSGASEAKLHITADKLETRLSGASELDLFGTVKNHILELSGASELDAENLNVQETDIHIFGASEANIMSQKVTGKASGASDVKVKAVECSIKTSGASSVKRK